MGTFSGLLIVLVILLLFVVWHQHRKLEAAKHIAAAAAAAAAASPPGLAKKEGFIGVTAQERAVGLTLPHASLMDLEADLTSQLRHEQFTDPVEAQELKLASMIPR